jgi:hypothetical protein
MQMKMQDFPTCSRWSLRPMYIFVVHLYPVIHLPKQRYNIKYP